MDVPCQMAFEMDRKSEKINPEIFSRDKELTLDLEWELEEMCKLKMLGADLDDDSPVVLYIGEDGESVWNGLQQTNTRLIYFSTIPTSTSSFYQLVQKAANYIFEYISNSDVYIVGHGLGALLVSKLLSNKDCFTNTNINRLQAVFLISGIYNTVKDIPPFEKEKDLEDIIVSMNNASPLFDDFGHLLRPGVRLYVFSADKDEPRFKVQSRQMFERFADCCDQSDLHFEIKEKFDRKSLLEEMCKPNNFLGRLIRYDICLSQSR